MGLDGTLEAALDAAAPAMRGLRLVLLTFGNAAFSELLRNFCAHARRAGAAHVVGAVDVGEKREGVVFSRPLRALRAA